MNFEYLDTDHTLDSEHDTNATESAGENWNRIDTFKLIALFKEHHDYYRTVDSKTMFWKFIQEQLQKQCIVVSVTSYKIGLCNEEIQPFICLSFKFHKLIVISIYLLLRDQLRVSEQNGLI